MRRGAVAVTALWACLLTGCSVPLVGGRQDPVPEKPVVREPVPRRLPPREQLPALTEILRYSGFRFVLDGQPALPDTPAFIGPQENILFGQRPYGERLARLRALVRDPDPVAEPTLIRITQAPGDPLSPHAMLALAALHTPEAFACILRAVEDGRAIMRSHALAILLEANVHLELPDLCLDRFRNDPDGDVRTVAAIGLGTHRVEEAVPDLARALGQGTEGVRFASAWALWRLGESGGRRFLEHVSRQDDPNLAPQAIRILAHMGDPASAPILLLAFDSRLDSVWLAALEGLRNTPASMWEYHRLIEPLGEDPGPVALRGAGRRALACIAAGHVTALGQGIATTPGREVWRGLLWLSEQGSRAELLLLARTLREWDDPRSFEPLLRSLSVPRDETRAAAQAALAEKARLRRWTDAPALPLATPWWRWWLGKSTVFERTRGLEQTVLVRTPDGLLHLPVAGLSFGPAVRVLSVRLRTDGEPAMVIFGIGEERVVLREELN